MIEITRRIKDSENVETEGRTRRSPIIHATFPPNHPKKLRDTFGPAYPTKHTAPISTHDQRCSFPGRDVRILVAVLLVKIAIVRA